MLKLGPLYNDTLFSSLYAYQMGASVSPVLMYPALRDKPKNQFQVWDNPLLQPGPDLS